MKIINIDNNKDDLLIFCNVLNEVRNGFKVNNILETIGDSQENLTILFHKISLVYKSSKNTLYIPQTMTLTKHEATILANSINATLEELNYPGEFQTRVGATREEAEELLKVLGTL